MESNTLTQPDAAFKFADYVFSENEKNFLLHIDFVDQESFKLKIYKNDFSEDFKNDLMESLSQCNFNVEKFMEAEKLLVSKYGFTHVDTEFPLAFAEGTWIF